MKNSDSAIASGSLAGSSASATEPSSASQDGSVTVTTTAQVKASPFDAPVEEWFRKHFHNLGPLLEERVYNIIHAAKEDLKAVLRSI